MFRLLQTRGSKERASGGKGLDAENMRLIPGQAGIIREWASNRFIQPSRKARDITQVCGIFRTPKARKTANFAVRGLGQEFAMKVWNAQ
jgi:hypothetical protein